MTEIRRIEPAPKHPEKEEIQHLEGTLRTNAFFSLQREEARIEGSRQIAKVEGPSHARAIRDLAKAAVDAVESRKTIDRLYDESVEGATDQLTGLGNRLSMKRYVDRITERAPHTNRKFWVGMVDLDGVKAINDNLTHAGGDLIINAGAQAILAAKHPEDEAFRVGGDEFAIVMLQDPTVNMDAEELEEKWRNRLGSRLDDAVSANDVLREATQEGGFEYGASFGLVEWDPSTDEFETALNLADVHMYQDKHGSPVTSDNSGENYGLDRIAS